MSCWKNHRIIYERLWLTGSYFTPAKPFDLTAIYGPKCFKHWPITCYLESTFHWFCVFLSIQIFVQSAYRFSCVKFLVQCVLLAQILNITYLVVLCLNYITSFIYSNAVCTFKNCFSCHNVNKKLVSSSFPSRAISYTK